jgi:hypothetical protein
MSIAVRPSGPGTSPRAPSAISAAIRCGGESFFSITCRAVCPSAPTPFGSQPWRTNSSAASNRLQPTASSIISSRSGAPCLRRSRIASTSWFQAAANRL